jgi:hypothetical protein
MISITWKFAAALSVAGAIALAATPADARSARTTRSTVSNQAMNAPPPSFRRSQNYYSGGMASGGINFGDGRMGANYNPNGG